MDALWVNKYRPQSFEDLIGQVHAKVQLEYIIKSGNLPNLLLCGPPGVGKSSTAEIVARAFYEDTWEGNFIGLNASNIFEQGRKYLEISEPFSRFYQERKSVLDNFKYAMNRIAGIVPLDAPFKILFINDADALPVDAQQALRRTIERYNRTCKFIFATTRPANIIDPLGSRCLRVQFTSIDKQLMFDHLKAISGQEGCPVSDEILDAIIHLSPRDLRKALTILQIVLATDCEAADLESVYRVSAATRPEEIRTLLELSLNSEPGKAMKVLDTLLLDKGLRGNEIVDQLAQSARSIGLPPKSVAKVLMTLGKADLNIIDGANERIQLESLIAELGSVKY